MSSVVFDLAGARVRCFPYITRSFLKIFENSLSEDICLSKTERIISNHLIFALTFLLTLSCYKY